VITEQVLVDFTKGKKYAFDVIYSSYAAGMYAICLRYTRCEDDAQDVLQEAFIKVYKNQSQYQLTSPIGAWIKSITINTALTYIQKTYKYQLHEDENVFDELVWEEEPTVEVEELRAKLMQILNKLPEGYRLVFNLFAIENLSHKEICWFMMEQKFFSGVGNYLLSETSELRYLQPNFSALALARDSSFQIM
jgi:RNA polymerase sigma-70 factor (ECF subfamily)